MAAASAGSLGNTPLLHLLASMADRQMSGTMSFETPEHLHGAVVFERGTPRKVEAAAPQCRLSDLLVEFGWLGRPEAEQTYAMAIERHELHGRVLLDCCLMDKKGLSNVLSHQLIRKLDWVATQPGDTMLELHEGADLLTNVESTPSSASALAVIWGVARYHVDERNKRAVLDRVAGLNLTLHQRSLPELFGFNAEELAMVEQLRRVRTDASSLLCETTLRRQTAEALLYVLLLTRHIDIGGGRTPIGVGERSSVLPPKLSGERNAVRAAPPAPDHTDEDPTQQLRGELLRRAQRAESNDHYALFGVAPDAPIATIRNTFTTLARRYHPERLPAELNDLRPVAAKLMTRMMSAYRELADPDQRAIYDCNREAPGSDAERERITNRALALEALRRAEQLLKRDRLLLAEAQAQRALALDPQNPQCIAIEAWIRALMPEQSANLGPILDALTKALDLEPMNVETRYYRSEVLKRQNRLDEAVAEWRLILDLAPNHIEAQRELRLWELRRASSRPPKKSMSGTYPQQQQVSLAPPPPGLFGRLFKGSR
jgi:tetratricopeptide (TPR) repeat protein